MRNNLNLTNTLINAGADLRLQAYSGLTPLHYGNILLSDFQLILKKISDLSGYLKQFQHNKNFD